MSKCQRSIETGPDGLVWDDTWSQPILPVRVKPLGCLRAQKTIKNLQKIGFSGLGPQGPRGPLRAVANTFHNPMPGLVPQICPCNLHIFAFPLLLGMDPTVVLSSLASDSFLFCSWCCCGPTLRVVCRVDDSTDFFLKSKERLLRLEWWVEYFVLTSLD